jgi:hypothetical protein
MQREKKTAQELSDMISERLGAGATVTVAEDPAHGWHPTVFAWTDNADVLKPLQRCAEEIAKELRATFDLKT